ncbi:MAG: dTDP-4-dehydrorhamnose reductase [Dysgonamonadaceae bacterium]|nr:dTDP-4-dehydrorhamnose reductase [Dysgonamonadaceae bacterium]
MKNILITGANGQLGHEFRDLYSKYRDFNFISTDIDSLDLTDKKEISAFIEKNKIDCIVNCAAYTAVDKAEDEAELCYRVNRDAVGNLAESARVKALIIHISTDYVFDGKSVTPYIETDATNPQSVYGKSKCEGEEILLKYCPESIIIRTAWLYSTYGNNFVKTMLRLGKERQDLNVVYDQKGTPTYAADLAQAVLDIISCIEKGLSNYSGIYHYSNEGVTTWFDFTEKIFQLAGIKNCTVHPITTDKYPTKAVRPMYSVLNKTKIRETFNISVPEWENSLEKCLGFLN